MIFSHVLGVPRIGRQRELKLALERHWRGEIDEPALEALGRSLRAERWAEQRAAGLDWVTVGDFAWYDHVAQHVLMFGCEPARMGFAPQDSELARHFRLGRGQAAQPASADGAAAVPGHPALEMTKWFDTNYHYLVPEFRPDTAFRLASHRLLDEVREAQALGHPVKPVLLGPLSFLWLGKSQAPGFDRLELLDRLLPVYLELLTRLGNLGLNWVQVDEPILGLELPPAWREAFPRAYARLQPAQMALMLTSYFAPLGDRLALACSLPVAGLHLDGVRAPQELEAVAALLPQERELSVGLIDGRNIWRSDLDALLPRLRTLHRLRQGRLWLAPSCSLLHVPLGLSDDAGVDPGVRPWLAGAREKLDELRLLKTALCEGQQAVAGAWAAARAACAARRADPRLRRPAVAARLAALQPADEARHRPHAERAALQQARLGLPLLPTTTIGSFPQTAEIRAARAAHRAGRLDDAGYEALLRQILADTLQRQEALGLDVLVHGEAERNDMVEYFGEQLAGYTFSANGWVQSYGSRCVKPPILYGDVERPQPMTVARAREAQALSRRPVKGMLTGPVTMLQWSFVRDDQPRETTALQLALAIRDEVRDLEAAGIAIIQIDEPALREGLPLPRSAWADYLRWATRAFRLTAGGVGDATQIHTHMCYAEFGDILDSIIALDADVITLETSRSGMALLDEFRDPAYPNDIGPGVYDIHSPRVPAREEVLHLLRRAMTVIPPQRLWVNPDCGLKTRGWPETEAALRVMVEAARTLRAELGTA